MARPRRVALLGLALALLLVGTTATRWLVAFWSQYPRQDVALIWIWVTASLLVFGNARGRGCWRPLRSTDDGGGAPTRMEADDVSDRDGAAAERRDLAHVFGQ